VGHAHCAFEQISVALQVLPQVPQLAASVPSATHLPALSQYSSPQGQAQ
jgi:hypothetical protein